MNQRKLFLATELGPWAEGDLNRAGDFPTVDAIETLLLEPDLDSEVRDQITELLDLIENENEAEREDARAGSEIES